jgi:hypothetical protein
MIVTSTASQNWEKNIEEPDMKKGMKYIIKVHKMLIEKEKVRDLLHIFEHNGFFVAFFASF